MFVRLAFVVLILAVVFGAHALGATVFWAILCGIIAAVLFYFLAAFFGPIVESLLGIEKP